MVEVALILDALIIALLFAMLALSRFRGEEVHQRLDDVIDGVGIFAQEVLKRTQNLTDLAAPAIELHNHNPLEQIFRFIQGMKTGDFGNIPDANITNPRDSQGRYATPQEENSPSPEVIDITD
jgi:hypothetical protein